VWSIPCKALSRDLHEVDVVACLDDCDESATVGQGKTQLAAYHEARKTLVALLDGCAKEIAILEQGVSP